MLLLLLVAVKEERPAGSKATEYSLDISLLVFKDIGDSGTLQRKNGQVEAIVVHTRLWLEAASCALVLAW